MSAAPLLDWLAPDPEWRGRLRATLARPDAPWSEFVALAGKRLDFVLTNALDQARQRRFGATPPPDITGKPVRLALLGLLHLRPSACGAAGRRAAPRDVAGRIRERLRAVSAGA